MSDEHIRHKKLFVICLLALFLGFMGLVLPEATEPTGGGGGGVSFNGSEVDLNGSNLKNGTISNYSTLDYTNSSLSGKVNKSGDNFSQIYSRLNISRCGQSSGNCEMTSSLDAMSYNGVNYLFFTSERWYNTSTLSWNYGSHPERGGAIIQVAGRQILFRQFAPNSLTPLSSFVGDNVSARLYDGNGNLAFRTTNTYSEFYNSSNPVIIQNMTGSGNDYVCVDSTGKLFRSNTAC